MPEAPEIKYLELLLRNKVLGKVLSNITSNTKTTRKLPSASKVIDTGSVGKILWLQTNKYYVHLHMGLTGWLVFEKPKIYKYVLHFGNDIDVYIRDQRRFSKLDIYETKEQHQEALAKLGRCIFCKDFTFEYFDEVLGDSKRNISAFLLDQKNLAGIGNYIRNEALYIAHLSPKRKIDTLSKNDREKLYHAIMFVIYSNLYEWLDEGGLKVPVRLKKLAPKKLSVPYRMRVYDREVDNAGRRITFLKSYAGRKTFYVPDVQK